VKQRRLYKKETERERETYEIKKITKDVKEEFNTDMENLRKNKQTETLEIKASLTQVKNTGESHSSRLKQAEDRISGLVGKIDTEEKTEELLDKRLKS
jgi:hypothetical protein